MKAKAFLKGYNDSPVTSATFTIEDPATFDAPVGSGLRLWLLSDRGITSNSSGAISQWNDQSGLGNTAAHGSAQRQPSLLMNAVNGRPAIKFDGKDDLLTTSWSQWIKNDYSYFLVMRKEGGAVKRYHPLLTRAGSFTNGLLGSFELSNFSDVNGLGPMKARSATPSGDALGATSFGNTNLFTLVSVTRKDNAALARSFISMESWMVRAH